jgi:hypothetical protein
MIGTHRLAGSLAAAGFLITTACGSNIFDSNCQADRIVAQFDGAFAVDGTPSQLQREDGVAATNLSPDAFRQLNGVLLEGQAPVGGVVWTHGGIGTANDFFAIAVAAPLQNDQVRAVSSTFQGGGWGPLPVDGAAFALRLDGLWATAVEGQVTVVEAAPLQLDVELTITLSDGSTASVSGTDTFRYVRGTCPDARN